MKAYDLGRGLLGTPKPEKVAVVCFSFFLKFLIENGFFFLVNSLSETALVHFFISKLKL